MGYMKIKSKNNMTTSEKLIILHKNNSLDEILYKNS
jgi:hypothetical protein